MVCESLFNLFGTSSEEIITRAKQEYKREFDAYYLSVIEELSSSNKMLSFQIEYLKSLLKQNNISFNFDTESLETDMSDQ